MTNSSILFNNLNEIINEVNNLLPQLSSFIYQFNSIVTENSINVITEANGNMSLDVPLNMADNKAEQLSRRISIIDRLISNQSEKIENLLDKGLIIEKELKQQNSQYTSQILEKVNELKKLNNLYKH